MWRESLVLHHIVRRHALVAVRWASIWGLSLTCIVTRHLGGLIGVAHNLVRIVGFTNHLRAVRSTHANRVHVSLVHPTMVHGRWVHGCRVHGRRIHRARVHCAGVHCARVHVTLADRIYTLIKWALK